MATFRNFCITSSILVILVVLASHVDGAAPLSEASPCSTMKYLTGSVKCWMPYTFGNIEAYLPTQAAVDNDTTIGEKMLKAFMESCKQPLDHAVTCLAQLDQQCGYSLVNTNMLKGFVRSVCYNFKELNAISQCAKLDVMSLRTCLTSTRYDGDICALTTGLKKCFLDITKSCGPEVNRVVIPLMTYLFTMDKCLGYTPQNAACLQPKADIGLGFALYYRYTYDQRSMKCVEFVYGGMGGNDNNFDTREECQKTCLPPCSAASSLGSVAMCYSGVITELVFSGMQGPQAAYKAHEQLCNDRGQLNAAIKCQADVQNECKIEYTNTHEMAAFLNSTCLHLKELKAFSQCVGVPGGMSLLTCNISTSNESDPTTMLSEVTNNFRGCASDLFKSCSSGVEPWLSTVLDIFSLNLAPGPGPTCSKVEHISTLDMCWYPTLPKIVPIMGIMLPLNSTSSMWYNVNQYIGHFCRSQVQDAIKCHVAVDNVCGKTTLEQDRLEKLVKTICLKTFTEVGTCLNDLTTIGQFGYCMLAMKTWNPAANGALCQMSDHIQLCMKTMLTKCSDPLTNALSELLSTVKYGCR